MNCSSVQLSKNGKTKLSKLGFILPLINKEFSVLNLYEYIYRWQWIVPHKVLPTYRRDLIF